MFHSTLNRLLGRLSLLALLCSSPVLAGPSTKSTPLPALTQIQVGEPKLAKISREAEEILSQMHQAYGEMKSAEFDGQIIVVLDLPDKEEKKVRKFSSSFLAPNEFRHEMEKDLVIGSNGKKSYIYNKKANAYLTIAAPEAKAALEDMPVMIPELLQSQNPSLLFVLIKNPINELRHSFEEISRGSNVTIEGVSHPSLKLNPGNDQGKIIMVVDGTTHLIRRMIIDIKPILDTHGHEEIMNASITIDYTKARPADHLTETSFAWTPPANAENLAAGAERPNSSDEASNQKEASLEGKKAPDFTLKSLSGQEVSLADLKGKQVVLDFWATWCPPCVASLPHLAELLPDASQKDVAIYTINVGETKEQVEAFLKARNLQLPVLLDQEGTVSELYHIRSIPQTVVIGKDGTIKKVYVGFRPGMYTELREVLGLPPKEK